MSTTGTRFKGTLKKWDGERGFGFVTAEQGGQDVFVHVSAFPRNGQQPAVGELLSFEIERDREGRKRAVRVQRPGFVQPVSEPHPTRPRSRESTGHRLPVRSDSRSAWSLGTGIFAVLLVAAMGVLAYKYYAAPPVRSTFQCDGRQHCSQMTSCTEARYFLKNCPSTLMDGDGDGVPCEQQLCTSLFGR
jgi:cold shock CspA family protein